MRTGRNRLVAAGIVAVALLVGYVGVQTWVNRRPIAAPRYLEFAPSPDQDAVDMKGVPLVKGYTLEIFRAGAAAPEQTIDLGKPTPSANGTIRIELASLPIKALAAGVVYEAAISAVGPYGRGDSDRSNRFVFRDAR